MASAIPKTFAGMNPNMYKAQLLEETLINYERRLQVVNTGQAELQYVLLNSDHESLKGFLDTLNAAQTKVRKDAIDKISHVFAILLNVNQSIGATKFPLERLYGVIQCAISLAHRDDRVAPKYRRDVLRMIEEMAWGTGEVKEDDLKLMSIVKAFDLLASIAVEFVGFCIKLITLGKL
jgi:hypothetical protein